MNAAAWGWPQWVMAAYLALFLVVNIANQGLPRGTYNGVSALLLVSIVAYVLFAGGFWGG